jgi:hypothetical protein
MSALNEFRPKSIANHPGSENSDIHYLILLFVKRTRHTFVDDLRSQYTPDPPGQILPIWVGMKGGKKCDEPGF